MPLISWLPLTQLPLQATTDSSDDPFQSISDFFSSSTWSLVSFLLRVFVVLLWLALVWWTYQDARRRITSPPFVAGSVALSVLLPFLGTIIYLVVRPPEYLLEARERELELIALEQRLGALGDEEGQRIVGRLRARENGGEGPSLSALRQAGVATREELQDLDIRLTEIEYRLRRAAGAARAEAERGRAPEHERPRSAAVERPRPSEAARRAPAEPEPSARRPADAPSAEDTGRTMIRRMRRTVRPDPEASVE